MLSRSYRLVRHFSKASDDSAVMLKRELVADVIQNALKVSAYMASGSHAVKAEIMRAALDAGNHVVMYFANYWARQSPDEFHNYGNSHSGYGKYKNLAVMLPGICFGFSGMYNLISPIYGYYYNTIDMSELTLNPLSLSVPST